MKQSLFRRNLALIVSVVSLATIAFVAIAVVLTDRLAIESSSSALLKTAALASAGIVAEGTGAKPGEGGAALSQKAEAIGRLTGYRVTIIGKDGAVLADSEADPAVMENHAGRSEVMRAQAGESATAVRRSTTTNLRMLYAAVPLAAGGPPNGPGQGVLRLAMPLPPIFRRMAEAQWMFVLLLLFIAALSLIVSAAIGRQIAVPVSYIIEKAQAYAEDGEPPSRSALPIELRILDESLDDLVRTIRQRREEAEDLGRRYSSILEAAGEGVIAADSELRILEANSAAAGLFDVPKTGLTGKTIIEALGNGEVATIFSESLRSSRELFRDLRLFRNGERYIKVHTTVSGEGKNAGVVAVFSDITELKRLETVRKEFVANVSHELRTPIQVIRGYAEILDGESENPDAVRKYLGLIEKNAQRMERIVSDLLSLARLENDPSSWLRVQACDLGATINAALAAVEPSSSKKRIGFDISCPAGLSCVANAGLIEQALVNLLDNAVNYSPEASRISIVAKIVGKSVEISVADRGIGIPAADLPHIFERFYRVDKSRSKSTGGTGLGLAIVRHIAAIHGGEARVLSYANEGSTFTISLPLNGPPGIPASGSNP